MTILSIANLRLLVDISTHKSDIIVTNSLESVEVNFIKKFYKDSLFIYILNNLNVSPPSALVELILGGGTYEDNISPPKSFHLYGLNKAIALLTYCDLMIKQTSITRFGATNKNDQYSTKPNVDDSIIQINRYRETAIAYLKEIDYMLINCDETEFSTGDQAIIEIYREENNNEVKRLFEAFE